MIDYLASAFAGEAFAGLECLDLSCLDSGDDGLTKLCQGLEGNPCINTLKSISLVNCKADSKDMETLGNLIAGGALPCLERLYLTEEKIMDVGIVYLAEGFKAVGPAMPLRILQVNGAKISDAGLEALSSVIAYGRLPALEDLSLEGSDISDDGAVILSQTIQAGHLKKLTKLSLSKNAIEAKAALLLAAAVSIHCPSLTHLSFSPLEAPIQVAIRAMLKDRKGLLNISFRNREAL